jgi:hypothetical protein
VPLKGVSQSSSLLLALVHFAVALAYMALHSAIYFLQFTTLNVAFISSSTTLLTVLVSNNFVELKGSIFKKCGPETLFQLCGGDIVTPPPPLPTLGPINFQNFCALSLTAPSHFVTISHRSNDSTA